MSSLDPVRPVITPREDVNEEVIIGAKVGVFCGLAISAYSMLFLPADENNIPSEVAKMFVILGLSVAGAGIGATAGVVYRVARGIIS